MREVHLGGGGGHPGDAGAQTHRQARGRHQVLLTGSGGLGCVADLWSVRWWRKARRYLAATHRGRGQREAAERQHTKPLVMSPLAGRDSSVRLSLLIRGSGSSLAQQ